MWEFILLLILAVLELLMLLVLTLVLISGTKSGHDVEDRDR